MSVLFVTNVQLDMKGKKYRITEVDGQTGTQLRSLYVLTVVATHTAAFWIMTQHILVDGYRPFEGSFSIFGAERNEGTKLSRFVDNYLQTVKLKVKQSRYRPGVAQRITGS